MMIIEGRKYFLQEDVKAVVGKTSHTIRRLMRDGEIEPPVARVGIAQLWNEKQFNRIKKQFGSAA